MTMAPMQPSDLKSWRTERGLKSEQLAALLGVSRAAVSRWENGRHEIPAMLELALRELERPLRRMPRHRFSKEFGDRLLDAERFLQWYVDQYGPTAPGLPDRFIERKTDAD